MEGAIVQLQEVELTLGLTVLLGESALSASIIGDCLIDVLHRAVLVVIIWIGFWILTFQDAYWDVNQLLELSEWVPDYAFAFRLDV